MLSLDHCGFSLLFLSIVTGVSCQDLTPLKTEEFSSEGSSVTLSYRYSKGAGDYFFWYRQYPGKPPEFLISHQESGEILSDPVSGLSVKVNDDRTRMDLQISSAAVTDSAVYYCALNANYKLIFGRGTRLTIETRDNYLPSYYKLTDGDTTACLATGFSRYKATNNHKDLKDDFNKTEATRISGDSLYNSVVLLEGARGGQCVENTGNPKPCVDGLEQDPTVNGVTLTILGLRLLFLKTIIFNVLMTLRLWISH